MRRLVVIPHALGDNIYVRELSRAYGSRACDVALGTETLYDSGRCPAIIHLNWPEEHYRWHGGDVPQALARRFLDALAAARTAGTQLVWSVHNLAPHEHSRTPLDRSVYQHVLNLSPILVHHCEASRSLLRQRYTVPADAREVVQPHGAYFGYPGDVGKREARERLGIPADAFVFLSFGRIRAYKGLDLLLRAFGKCRVRDKYLVVAGYYGGPESWMQRLRIAFLRRFSGRVKLLLHAVPEAEVQAVVAACNAMVLSHLAGLNSGVAVLGMTFGRPVVAPRIGCIPEVLNGGMNVLYDVGRISALARAMETVSGYDAQSAERANVSIARTWTWERIVDAILREIKGSAPVVA